MRYVILLLAVLGLAGTGYGVWHHFSGNHAGPAFRTAAVERGDLLATINSTGTIEPEEVIDVGAQVNGRIDKFGRDPRDSSRSVDYTTPVEEGTVLAVIDPSLYQAQVDQAQANLVRAQADQQRTKADAETAKAKFRQADRDFTRAKTLFAGKAIADVDYDTAQATYETTKTTVDSVVAQVGVADAAIKQAKASLDQADINLGYCTIKSPVKGVIVDRRINVGQTVVSGLNAPSLFLLAKDLKRMQIWVSVNEADIGNIHTGQSVTFTVDAYPRDTFKGQVSQIRLNASMTQNVVTYTVVVDTDNSNGKLLPYLTANVQFEADRRKDVLLAPNAALRWRPDPALIAPDARAAYESAQLRRKEAKVSGLPKEAGEKEKGGERGTVWLTEGEFVRPLRVQTGLSDGVNTEISGDGVTEGMDVVVGETRARGDAAGGTTNPFAPQMFGGKQKQ